jgi:hypothetical protein
MMIEISIILLVGYFTFWLYAFLLTMRFKKTLLNRFPEEAKQCLRQTTIFGHYNTAGFLYLWDDKIKNLAGKENKIERLRKKASICIILSFATMFLLPVLILIIAWLTSASKGL